MARKETWDKIQTLFYEQVPAMKSGDAYTAIFDIGDKKVAFVAKGDGEYTVRQVKLGVAAENTVEILSGLKEGERVVSRGGLVSRGRERALREHTWRHRLEELLTVTLR